MGSGSPALLAATLLQLSCGCGTLCALCLRFRRDKDAQGARLLWLWHVRCSSQASGQGSGRACCRCGAPWVPFGPQHCHVPRSPPIPGFSEQNEVAASARRRGPGHKAGLSQLQHLQEPGTGTAGNGSGVVVTAAHRASCVRVDSIVLLEKPVLWLQSTTAHTSTPTLLLRCAVTPSPAGVFRDCASRMGCTCESTLGPSFASGSC